MCTYNVMILNHIPEVPGLIPALAKRDTHRLLQTQYATQYIIVQYITLQCITLQYITSQYITLQYITSQYITSQYITAVTEYSIAII